MPVELFIALRYLLARRRQAFISLISLISTIGVAVGVMALIIALALMTGLQGELRDRLLGATAHVYVWKTAVGGITDHLSDVAALEGLRGVSGAAPAIVDKALISSEAGSQFITIKGIDPALERRVTDIEPSMLEGRLDALATRAEGNLPGILLGRDLAAALDVTVGQAVTLLTPQGTLSPLGMMPRPRRATVAGIYNLGIYEFDAGYGLVSLDFARRLSGRELVELIQLRVDDIYDAPAVVSSITTELGDDYLARDWSDITVTSIMYICYGLQRARLTLCHMGSLREFEL